MVAAISALFGKSDVILDGNHLDVPLCANHICDAIDIRCKGTDNSDPCDVIDMCDHVVDRGLQPVAFQLLHNRFRRLDTRLDMFYRIVLMHMLKLFVQDLHLRLNLAQRSTIDKRNLFPTVYSVPVT